MPKSSDEGEADRLTSEEFVDLIPHLPFENILQIEFFSTQWKNLITTADALKRLFRCNLCHTILSGYKSVLSHICGKKHLGNMRTAKYYYHPEYTFTKQQLQKSFKFNEPQNKLPLKCSPENDDCLQKAISSDQTTAEDQKLIANTNRSNQELITNQETDSESKNYTSCKNDSLEEAESCKLELSDTSQKTDSWEIARHPSDNMDKRNKRGVENPENKNKPLLRLVPIKDLKENTEVCEREKLSDTEIVLNQTINDLSVRVIKHQNEESTKTNDDAKLKKENSIIFTLNQEPNSKTDRLFLQETSQNNLSNEEQQHTKKNKDASRKLVKNPLATKRNDESKTVVKSNKEITDTVMDIIIIDDNDEKSPTKSYEVNKNTLKISEPPVKKLKSLTTTSNNSGPHSSVITIPKKSLLSPIKNENKINEPPFATKSVTDAIDKDGLCGFVGIEYVIKICRNGAAIKYECGLCELLLDGQSMQNHLLGYTHRLKFCEKHFPTAIQQFRQYIVNVPSDEHYKVMIPVLQKLTVAIEEHHGRALPYVCEERRYNLERHRVLTEVFARRHASEQRGPTFTHVIDSKQVDEFIKKKDSMKLQPNFKKVTFDQTTTSEPHFSHENIDKGINRKMHNPKNLNLNVMRYQKGNVETFTKDQLSSSLHHYSSQNVFMDDETHKRMVDNFLKANSKNSFSQENLSRSNTSEREYRKRSHTPPRATFVPKKDNISHNIWNNYCRLVDSKLKILREQFQKFRVNPESHPSYKDEWLKFWHQRKSELLAEGKDYRTYDFQPDWVPYFNNRINELYDESFEKLKIAAREELSLPLTNNCLRDPKYFVHEQAGSYLNIGKKVMEPMAINSNFLKPLSSDLNKNIISQAFTPTRADFPDVNKMRLYSKDIEIRDESAPTVISVLRLLTALEEHLGSLGPKIVDLLSKALQAEKSSQGHAEVLLTEENCTVLETAMEKFKGLIIAGILEASKERALKKAISNVNDLLQYSKVIKRNHYKSIMESHVLSDVDVENNDKKFVLNINDKIKQTLQSVSSASDISNVIGLIEEKISAALKAQGRTNVDRAHLEQLAAVCVLLEQKKREASNAEHTETRARHQAFPQPLSETLKTIVGNLTENTFEHVIKNQHHSDDFSSQFSNNLASMRKNISQDSITKRYSSTSNDHSNKSVTNTVFDGNFSNLYSKNSMEFRMDETSNLIGNPLPRDLIQQQQHKISSLPRCPQDLGSSWGINEPTVNNMHRSGFQNAGQKTSIQKRFRHNYN